MKINVLRSAWQQAHTGGNVWIVLSSGELADDGKQTGKFAVTYAQDGKIYTYQYKSVYKLAERLHMIPQDSTDIRLESEQAIIALQAGRSYTSLGGLSDTIRFYLRERTGKEYTCHVDSSTKDEYDRTLYVYSNLHEFRF